MKGAEVGCFHIFSDRDFSGVPFGDLLCIPAKVHSGGCVRGEIMVGPTDSVSYMGLHKCGFEREGLDGDSMHDWFGGAKRRGGQDGC